MNQGFWNGLKGGGVPFWLHGETMTFICSAAYQNTAVIQTGVNKNPPNFDTLFVMTLEGLWLFKGITARHL
jgi:hypothetical protein